MMVTKRVRGLSISMQLMVLLITPLAVFSQSNAEKRKIFTQAETYFLYEEYELANPLYLLLETPDNMNMKFKIGTCYLNIPGEKEKAIPYLEQAVKNASYDSKTASLNEKRAPLDAYFFLGKAYLVNNFPDKALKTFTTFQKLARETENKGGMKNVEFVGQSIQAARIALELQIAPVLFTKENLGKDINQGALNNNPAVSFDGKTLVFTERRGINSTMYYSKKENDTWSKPVELAPLINAGNDCSSCSLNNDGTLLFLYKTDNYDGNIYYSEFVKNKWSPVRKLNSNINTKYYESHAAISADGKRLYFTSNREGGFGGLDIYVSEKDATGDWGTAVNLGPSVNTPFNEDTPFITANDSLLYFSSEGHNSIGGYDIFISRKTGNTWSKPENIGYPVNTTDDDKFFQPHNNGDNAFYAMPTDYKREEIFYLSFTGLKEETYEKLDLAKMPPATGIDSSRFYNNLVLSDPGDESVDESEVLFYTVQVMALYNPVDISYFKYVSDIKVIYNENDMFFRYTTGEFLTREAAYAHRDFLIRRGYPNDLFIKKVSRRPGDSPVQNRTYYTIQLKSTKLPVDRNTVFRGLTDVREVKEIDGMLHYLYGRFDTYEEARSELQKIRREEFSDAFVREINVILLNR